MTDRLPMVTDRLPPGSSDELPMVGGQVPPWCGRRATGGSWSGRFRPRSSEQLPMVTDRLPPGSSDELPSVPPWSPDELPAVVGQVGFLQGALTSCQW